MKINNLTVEQKGYLIPNLFVLVTLGLTRLGYHYFGNTEAVMTGNSGTFIFSEFIVIPILMGMISAWQWRNLGLNS